MATYLNPGNSAFSGILNGHYVDKTGLIGLINATIDTPARLTCISRPRRFGKSFAAQMLCAYYDKTCDSVSLFEDLKVSALPSWKSHLNRYDVIYIDMASALSDAGDTGLIPFLKNKISREIHESYPAIQAGDDSFLSILLGATEHSGNKFIMIIDEWDAPIREMPELHQEYLRFLRMLFKNSGTTSRIIAAGYMTGILPIKKDGTQSAVSDFREYSVLDTDGFAEYTGLTEPEVKALCQDYHMDFAEVSRWYDGYTFDEIAHIYNPYSVMTAMERGKCRSYWKKTSAAEALLTYINMDYEGLQQEIVRLIAGDQIKVQTDGFENDLKGFKSKDDVLTLLIHLGYLAYDEKTKRARIPNEEVRSEFDAILRKGSHQRLLELVRESERLLEDTIGGNETAVAERISHIHDTICSPAFYHDEQALRSVIRFAYVAAIDDYMKIEELPGGRGMADVVFIPVRESGRPALVIELKWNRSSESAIRQITEKHYPVLLKEYIGDVILVGISYDEKAKKHSCIIQSAVR